MWAYRVLAMIALMVVAEELVALLYRARPWGDGRTPMVFVRVGRANADIDDPTRVSVDDLALVNARVDKSPPVKV